MGRSPRLLKTCLVAAALLVAPQAASAVSFRVKIACANDYYAYCSAHAPGSPGVRRCMRRVGSKLSRRCVNALIDAGEVSQRYVERRRMRRRYRYSGRRYYSRSNRYSRHYSSYYRY